MIASAEAFDAVADAHDQARWSADQAPFDAAVFDALARLAARDESPALFLGCGSAREAQPYVLGRHDVTLVDYSSRMLDLAESRYRHCDNVSYVLQSAGEFLKSRTTERFGHVSCIGELLCYIDEPITLMRQVRGVLEPDGVFVFTWVDRHALGPVALGELVPQQGGDVVTMTERHQPPLTIAAWSQEHMAQLIVAAGFMRCAEIAAPDTPRRYWTTQPATPQ